MDELCSRIRYTHMAPLAGFREAVVNAGDGRARHTWRLGPVPSMENGFIQVTIVADLMGVAWLTSGRGPDGMTVTVLVVGHRADTGIRVAVTVAESDAWLLALLDRKWNALAYRLVETAKGGHGPSAATYRLFLDQQQHAIARPDEIPEDGYRLMQDHPTR
ncbi:hypothetical protein [Paenarthrobacter ureafaciens]|uniref:hypothetical protein n=1 Tax=Paenarthrobacter ureafaciens TaxID=37931 RepID=UPI002DBB1B41|nr:hypothetical protein [Paenarthrobacter ureafaciens]MEC3852049.1 hypothetical protein [Paenarthrobacter ureafaciens]